MKNLNHYHSNDRLSKEELIGKIRANEVILGIMNRFTIREEKQQILDFFFYSDQEDNAINLAIELAKLNYNLAPLQKSSAGPCQWMISGQTHSMPIDLKTMTEWTTLMCNKGFENNCEFDGWGTPLT